MPGGGVGVGVKAAGYEDLLRPAPLCVTNQRDTFRLDNIYLFRYGSKYTALDLPEADPQQ